MNTAALGSLYLEQASALGAPAASMPQAEGDGTFARLLRMAQGEGSMASQASAAESSAGRSKAAESRIGAAAGGIDRTSALYEQCRELETFVVKALLEGMRKTVQKSGLTDAGFAGKMYEDMLYDEYAKSLARNSGFGLADQAYLELSGRRGRTINLTL